jgi:hypothetical protein
MDLDDESGSFNLQGGDNDVTNPTTPSIKNYITAAKTIANHFGSNFIVSMANQTNDMDAYTAYGYSASSGITWGSYLPIVYALQSYNQIVETQCYNSGSMPARNGQNVSEGTNDFDVALSEMLLLGYHMANGQNFPAIPQHEVAFGVPATSNAADTASWQSPSGVLAAAKYLGSGVPDGGSYALEGGPYPNFAGVMTWDIDYDQNQNQGLASTLHPYLASIGGSSTGGGSIPNGAHTMAPSCATGSRLDVPSSHFANGQTLQIWQANGTAAQSWNFTSLGSNQYKMSVDGSYCLDSAGVTSPGTAATIWTCMSGNANQIWTAHSLSGGGYYFSVQNSGLCLDVRASGTANGTVVQTYTCNGYGGLSQTWYVN